MAEKQKVRNAGSSFTTFRYRGQPIALLESVSDTGQTAVAQPEFIHPLGARHPVEIVTARAIGGGTLTLSIREVWHREIWQQLQGLTGTHDIVDVFQRLANTSEYVTCAKIITPPDGRRYGKTYHRATIISVPDGETFKIDTLSQLKDITVAYTHTTPL